MRPGLTARGHLSLPFSFSNSLIFDFRHVEVFRYIEHYESVWKPFTALELEGGGFRYSANGEPLVVDGSEVYIPDRPRISLDRIETTNTQFQLGWSARPWQNTRIYWGFFVQDFYDVFYRNRLELQSGNEGAEFRGELNFNNGSMLSAEVTNAGTRRYFGNTITERLRLRNLLSITTDVGEYKLHISGYHHYWKSEPTWWNWNFSDPEAAFRFRIEDPNFPQLVPVAGWDSDDLSQAYLSNLRVHRTRTTDQDLAGRIDLERSFDFSRFERFRLLGGIKHREKERNNDEEREVYFPRAGMPLPLERVAYADIRRPVVRGRYDLPRGLDPKAGERFLAENPDFLRFDPIRSADESAQQRYRSEEAVTGAYLLNWWRTERWEGEAGLRYEYTSTHTVGTLTGLGAPVEMPADNSYHNWLPAVYIFNHSVPRWRFGGGTSQILMRPQYFDIVNYRRVSLPTRSISEGNPGLDPTLIKHYQFAVEYRTGSSGQISLELYRMDLSEFFYKAVRFEEYSVDGVGASETFVVSRVENGERGRIQGFKVQADRMAEFTGVRFHWRGAYVYSDSAATVSTRPNETFTVPGRSRHVVQSSLRMSHGPATVELGIFWQSQSLDDLGESSDRDVLRGSAWSTESSVSYRFNQRLQAALKVHNHFNLPERSTTGGAERVSQNQYSSWWADFSVAYAF
ncbi:MAG: outer membrane beta-barrel protein [Verrucomicrobia bacterium]|nr:outer membrane beta-barrel protein [Verrucomicrobiota bacterium]